MTDADALFVDTNILVNANVAEAPLHRQALSSIQAAVSAGRSLWISRQVLREYLTVLTRPQTFGALPKETVIEQVGQFIRRFEVADDTMAVTEQLITLLEDFCIGGKQIHDANIVATMRVYGIPCLLTHNFKDFQRFDGIIRIEAISEESGAG